MGINLCERCVADCRHHREPNEIVVKCGAFKPPMTAADVVEVVRCRKCKYWRGIDEFGDGYCGNPDGIDNVAKPDDFCSYGTRKEGAG